jgi:hypothetical protein
MSKHRLHYLDLRPEPLERPKREPTLLELICYVVAGSGTLYLGLVFALSL